MGGAVLAVPAAKGEEDEELVEPLHPHRLF
jgi:hypothetical protein